MSIHHALPSSDDLDLLSARTEHAVTIYVPTSPSPQDRVVSRTTVKSAFDEAVRQLKQGGASHGLLERLRSQWRAIDQDSELWGKLSSSLAIFLGPEVNEVFVLPNQLEAQSQVADHFDLGQLLRSVTFPHEAYAVTVSANGWHLWHATASARVTQVDVGEGAPVDAADATHRESIQGRGKNRALVGDEGKKVLLETYAHRVAEAVTAELNRRGVRADVPFFVCGVEPLLTLLSERLDCQVTQVPGAADRLAEDQLDELVRRGLDEHHARHANDRLAQIADSVSSGLIATDLGDVARAATRGLVDTLLFNFTVDIYGRLDEVSGEVERAEEDTRRLSDGEPAHDLLSQIAVLVLRNGGTVIAVRDEEMAHQIWNSVAVARLRGPLG